MSWLSRRGALSRLAQHFDHHLHDHHAASYYSLFRPTSYTNYTLTPFHTSPAEDLFRQFQPASLNRLFTLWDNSCQEGEKENKKNKLQTNNSKENKSNINTNSSSSGTDFNYSLQSNRSSPPPRYHNHNHDHHHLHRYRSSHHRQPLDSLANIWSPFVSFPIPSIVPSITLNLYSTPTSYQIQAELPGVKKEEIVISVEKGTITIEAEKKEERGNKSNTSTANNVNANANLNNNAANNINNTNNTENIQSTSTATSNHPSSPSSSSSSSSSSASSSSSSSSPSTFSSSYLSDSNANDVEELYVESHYGRVERSVSLPDDAALDGLIAKYEDGVIKIEIPRRQIQKEEKKIVQLQ